MSVSKKKRKSNGPTTFSLTMLECEEVQDRCENIENHDCMLKPNLRTRWKAVYMGYDRGEMLGVSFPPSTRLTVV